MTERDPKQEWYVTSACQMVHTAKTFISISMKMLWFLTNSAEIKWKEDLVFSNLHSFRQFHHVSDSQVLQMKLHNEILDWKVEEEDLRIRGSSHVTHHFSYKRI